MLILNTLKGPAPCHLFCFLGCEIRKDENVRNEVVIRIGKVGAAVRMFGIVWNAHNVLLSTKPTLFNSRVLQAQIYECKSWKGLKQVENRRKKIESKRKRNIMKIRWYDHVSEIKQRRRTGHQSVVEVIEMRG